MKVVAVGLALLAALCVVRPELKLELVSDGNRVIRITLGFRE